MLKIGSEGLNINGGAVRTIWSVLTNQVLILAVICFVSSMLMWILVLRKMDLSVAYPMVSLGYVIVILLSYVFLKEPLYISKIIGTVLIVAGVMTINLQ